MPYLTQSGTITYNGYSLQGPRNSVQLEVIPVRDSTKRYVTHSIYRFAIDAWITSNVSGETGDGTSAATHMTTIRGALQQDGGNLSITGFGFGDVVVNTSSTNRDVAWGPKTQVLKMRNIGEGCIVLVWVVEVALKTCSSGQLRGVIGQLKEYAYNVRYTIKRNGCTVRTVQGHLEIFLATQSAGGLTINQTADDYRDLVKLEVPDGFYRTQPQQYAVTKGSTRLEFSVTDEEPESDNIYPPGVSDMRLDHTVSSDLFGTGGGFVHQIATFTGHIEMARPYPVSLAWEKALLLMQERLIHAVNNNAAPLVDAISITEHMFERKISFTVRYCLMSSSLNALVSSSGLFLNVASTNIRTYKPSMQLAWSNRGTTQLHHQPDSDKLIDQCASNPQLSIKDRIGSYLLSGSVGSILLDCPPKDRSHLINENIIDFDTTRNNIVLDQMPPGPQSPYVTAEDIIDNYQIQAGTGFKREKKVQPAGDGSPRVRVRVRGRAYRVGYEPEIPFLVSVMGKKAGYVYKEGNQSITQVGFYGQCPIYAATWMLDFDIEFDSIAAAKAASNTTITDAVYRTPGNPNNKDNAPQH